LDGSHASNDDTLAPQIRLLSTPVAGSEWGVLVPRDESLRINGEEVLLGLRVLSDRDELSTVDASQPSTRWYFSTEEVVQVVPFPGSDHITRCPRCKQGIEAGAPAVHCPNPQCGAWHHQISAGHEKHRERECWTYATKCALCSQTTALDAGFRWTPEEL
jgi:hypothetical protein